MKKIKYNKWYVADFETTTEKFYNEFGNTQVWLYAISDENGDITHWGRNIEDFMQVLEKYYNKTIVYFHNLKFDGSFILNYLINNGFKYCERVDNNGGKSFSSLITDDGQFYQINIHFKRGVNVKIQDSLKLLPFKVKKIAEDFGLPIKKGIIDYDTYVIDEQTLDYVFNDVSIVAMALKEIKENGMRDMTTASCAYNNFKNSFIMMYSFFPMLDKDFLMCYRNAYRGGRSQVNPKFANKILNNVKRFDVNSMYPYIMYSQELPYGNPIPITKMGSYKFELYKILVSFELKPNHLPTLLKKGSMFGGEDSYYINTEQPEVICISSVDYELLCKHYNIIFLNVLEMWGFKTNPYMFRNYIDYWYEVKQKNKGAKRLIAKLMLNSLYGKFGSNCEGRTKIPFINEEGILSFEYSEVKEKRRYYLPVAIAITSYAHKLIDDAICSVGIDNFIYCDTDSVHTLKDLPIEMVDNKELGKFKLEGIENTSKYVRQKTYVYSEEIDGHIEYNITCAGMDDNSKNFAIQKYRDTIFEYFGVGFEVEGFKLLPKQVKGGVILCKTTFKIKG